MTKYYVFYNSELNGQLNESGSMEEMACEIAAIISQGDLAKENLYAYSESNPQATWGVLKNAVCYSLEIIESNADFWRKEAIKLFKHAMEIEAAIGVAYSGIVKAVMEFDNACERSENFQDARVFDDLGLDAAFGILQNLSQYSILNKVEEIFMFTRL